MALYFQSFCRLDRAPSIPYPISRTESVGLDRIGPLYGMLKLTKKADYGLIALRHLAGPARGQTRWARTASAKDIAAAYRIPLPLLSKVLQKLARAGLLLSEQGTNGGYRLARDARADQRAGSDPHHRRAHHSDPLLHRT